VNRGTEVDVALDFPNCDEALLCVGLNPSILRVRFDLSVALEAIRAAAVAATIDAPIFLFLSEPEKRDSTPGQPKPLDVMWAFSSGLAIRCPIGPPFQVNQPTQARTHPVTVDIYKPARDFTTVQIRFPDSNSHTLSEEVIAVSVKVTSEDKTLELLASGKNHDLLRRAIPVLLGRANDMAPESSLRL
jgi:hypothetical protein